MPRHFPRVGSIVLAAAVLSTLSTNVAGHEIPGDVTVHAWIKPEGQRLRFLVRVPLVAMRDTNYPTRGDRAAGVLDIGRADQTLRDAATLWVGQQVEMYEGDARLPYPSIVEVRASLPSDRSFASSYDEALAHLTGPRLSDDADLPWIQGMLDVLLEYPIQSERSRFSVHPRFDRLGLRSLTVLRFALPDGGVRTFELFGNPGLVRLDPTLWQSTRHFVALGFEHLFDNMDGLLFLLCLALPFRALRPLIVTGAAFTIAFSVTLIASAFGMAPDTLWFAPLIDTLIAASILYATFRIILAASVPSVAPPRWWAAAFAFGLVYGFGYAFALRRSLQFAGAHALASILSFNAGIELGHWLVLFSTIGLLGLLFKYVVPEQLGTIVLAALVAHTAWHWTGDRLAILRQFRFDRPAFDLAFWASAMRWGMVAVVCVGFYWVLTLFTRTADRDAAADDPRNHNQISRMREGHEVHEN